MEIQQQHDQNSGRFFVESDGDIRAKMTYSRSGDNLVIMDGTTVHDSLRGKGVGYKLMEAAVEWARENQVKMIPECPFVISVFEKKPEYADVLYQP